MEGVLQMKKLKDLPNHRSKSSVWIPPQAKNINRIPKLWKYESNRSDRKVTLSQAKQRGYTACKKCYR